MSDDIKVPMEQAADAFYVRASSFVVSGPNSDLTIQVAFCEDVVRHDEMTVSFNGDSMVASTFQFQGHPVRLVLGNVKLAVAEAKELVRLLESHIEKADQLIASLEKKS